MSNMKPDHNDDDGLTKEYTKNKNVNWLLSERLCWHSVKWWCFQTSSKNKVNKTEIGAWRGLYRDMTTDKYVQGLTLSQSPQSHL